jgi:hypothetical protein
MFWKLALWLANIQSGVKGRWHLLFSTHNMRRTGVAVITNLSVISNNMLNYDCQGLLVPNG